MIGNRAESKGEASAGEGDGVNTGATIDAGELIGVASRAEGIAEGGEVGAVEDEIVVSGSAVDDVSATVGGDGVVTGTSGDGVVGRCAADGISRSSADFREVGY